MSFFWNHKKKKGKRGEVENGIGWGWVQNNIVNTIFSKIHNNF
jgi:hypothetical protein